MNGLLGVFLMAGVPHGFVGVRLSVGLLNQSSPTKFVASTLPMNSEDSLVFRPGLSGDMEGSMAQANWGGLLNRLVGLGNDGT